MHTRTLNMYCNVSEHLYIPMIPVPKAWRTMGGMYLHSLSELGCSKPFSTRQKWGWINTLDNYAIVISVVRYALLPWYNHIIVWLDFMGIDGLCLWLTLNIVWINDMCLLLHLSAPLVPDNCTEGRVRLFQSTTRNGTVQVCVNRTWGSICGRSWDSRDATVTCRQLGFPTLGT